MKEATITLEAPSVTFAVKHNLHQFNITIADIVSEWYDKTDSYTANNFCYYVKAKNKNIICTPVK